MLPLLAAIADIDHCSSILKKLNYRPVKKLPSTPKEKKILKRKNNQLLFQHEQEFTDLEIHWRFFRKYKFWDIDFKTLHRKKTISYSLEGRIFRKLPNETEILYILVHGSKHAWFRLKWLIDVNDYIKNVDLDFDEVHSLAAQHNFLRMVSLYNALARDFIPNACLFPFGNNKFPKHLKRYAYKKIMGPTSGSVKNLSFGEKVLNVSQRILFEHSLNPNIYSFRQIINELTGIVFIKLKRRLKHVFPLKKSKISSII